MYNHGLSLSIPKYRTFLPNSRLWQASWRPTGAAAPHVENRLDGAIFRPASHATDANSISRKESIPDQDLGQSDVRMGESQGSIRPRQLRPSNSMKSR